MDEPQRLGAAEADCNGASRHTQVCAVPHSGME